MSKDNKKTKLNYYQQRTAFYSSKLLPLMEKLYRLKFKLLNVRKNSVLVIEPNLHSHAEVLPFFIKYFLSRKYNVDVIIAPWLNHLKCLNIIKSHNIRKFVFSPIDYKRFMRKKKIQNYKFIFFNSQIIYTQGKEISVYDFFPSINKMKDKIYCVQHHLDMPLDEHNIALAKIPNLNPKVTVANSHYFGEFKPCPKNECTQFIFVGALEDSRRDCNILIDAVTKLANKGITNFHITHIGRESLNVPEDIKKYFSFLGYLDFEDMIKEIKKSDFYLTLLNPDNKEQKRYITAGTSGSFQIIYGFLKPCLIHKEFAEVYNLKNCSIIYNSNNELADSMETAINLSAGDYNNLRDKLKEHVMDIEKTTENNLDKIFNSEVH